MNNVCLFPLPNSVTLKNISIPYHIFEHRYKTMVNDAIEHGLDIAVLLQSADGDYKDRICIAGFPTILNLYDNGRMDVVITGRVKCRLKKCKQPGPYMIYSSEVIEEDSFLTSEQVDDLELVRELVWDYINTQQVLRNQKDNIERILEDPETVLSYANLLLINDKNDKERLMELNSLSEKISEVISILSPESIELGSFIDPLKIK